jgi:hypothetical protein
VQAALFARSYFYAIGAGERLRVGGAELPIEESERASFGLQVTSLEALAAQLYDSVDFKSILCDSTTGLISPEGEGIPFTIGTAASSHPNMCGKATAYPDADGLYEFSEAHNMVYLAYQQACGAQRPGQCNYTNIELMWNRWQKRRNSPNHHYTNYPILSTSGGYMLQMLYYTTNSFNNDTRYQELFHNHWLADESFYKQALYAGKRGRYGLGEGPESKWCATPDSATYQLAAYSLLIYHLLLTCTLLPAYLPGAMSRSRTTRCTCTRRTRSLRTACARA